METRRFEKEESSQIADTIRDGGLVAIMTDTVYGLAASSHDGALYEKLKDVKERPETKPFPLMVSSLDQIEAIAEVAPWQRHLMDTFMPGAVTFIFKIKKGIFPFLGSQATIGIRMADDTWVQSLINQIGYPIWLPSANRSGLETGVTSDMVLEQLDGRIEGVVLGTCQGGTSSSVFDISTKEIKCYREGIIPLEAIKEEVQRYENSRSM